jgi:hypothetical protein
VLTKFDIEATIFICGNPGELHCDRSIATDKGWKVYFRNYLLVFKENTTYLKSWESYTIPTIDEVRNNYTEYNHAPNDWVVYLDENEIRVDDVRNYKRRDLRSELPFEIKQSNSKWTNISAPLAGLIDYLEVDDGYLIGFNRGEWGGELYWFSKNGKKRYEISGHQIVQFIKRDNKIYAIEGGKVEDSIIIIKKKMGKWVAEKYLKLPPAPAAVQLDSKDNLIIVTYGYSLSFDESGRTYASATPSLFSIDRNANIDTLVNDGMWGQLYPSSMVIQNDVVYIGMRKGVYKFDHVVKKDEWLLPE